MGINQEIETLINEEALLFAMFLRDERQKWIRRIVNLSTMSVRVADDTSYSCVIDVFMKPFKIMFVKCTS